MERKSIAKLQDSRSMRKLVPVDEHICLAFAGLTADARVLISKACIEAQSYRLTYDEPISVEQLTRYIAGRFTVVSMDGRNASILSNGEALV